MGNFIDLTYTKSLIDGTVLQTCLIGTQAGCMIQDARGWCTGMTQRDGIGREMGGGFRMGNTGTPVVDSC